MHNMPSANSTSCQVIAKLLADKLHPTCTVLVVIDVQNDFCHPNGEIGTLGGDLSQVDPFAADLQQLLTVARQCGVLTIFTRDVHSPQTDSSVWIEKHTRDGRSPFPREGTWGAELFSAIQPLATETVITKHRYSAFIGTDLDTMLRDRNVTTLVVAGLYTHVCVESTVRHGHMLDYWIVIPKECVMRGSRKEDPRIHEYSLQVMDYYFAEVVSMNDVLTVWRSSD